MEREQFEEIRQFARTLTEKRLQMADGQLLDQCQQHLDALLLYIEDNFEEHPHINDREAELEPGHSGQGPKLASNIDEPPPFTPSAPAPEPEPRHLHRVTPHKKGPAKKHR